MQREKSFKKDLAARIKAARTSAQLTQRALAERAGIAEKYLSRIEMAIAMPSVFVMYRLALALGLTLDDLAPTSIEGPARRRALRSLETALRTLEQGPPEQIARVARVISALLDQQTS